jgi:hypothetical protein
MSVGVIDTFSQNFTAIFGLLDNLINYNKSDQNKTNILEEN